MSFEQSYNSCNSFYDFYQPMSQLIPEISFDKMYQFERSLLSHDALTSAVKKSPSRSGANPLSCSVPNTSLPALLSTASSSYLSHVSSTSPPDFSRCSPSSLSGDSQRRFSSASPPGFPASSPTVLPSSSPSYLSCGSPSKLSNVGTAAHFSPTSSLDLPSTMSPPFISHVSPLGLSHDKPALSFSDTLAFSSASVSSTNNVTSEQSADSGYINLVSSSANVEEETVGTGIARRYDSKSESNGYSSSFVTSTQMYERESASTTEHDQVDSTSSSTWHSNVTPTNPPSHCLRNIHPIAQQRYCLTCSQPFCKECRVGCHEEHSYKDFVKYLQCTIDQGAETLMNARLTLNILQTDLEDVQLDAEMLDQKARQAAASVMSYIRRHISALEAREKELLNSIERARVVKFDTLKMKDEQLRNDKTRLTKTTYKLSTVLDSCNLTCNPKEILAVKDMTMAEMFQIKQNRRYRSTREESWISFTGPGNALMHEIATLGNIQTNNPGPIGEGRAISGSNSSQPHSPYMQKVPKPITRGRSVPDSTLSVVVRESELHNRVIRVIGDNGDTSDNLCRPWGITCDNKGHIIVADRSNNRIQIFREDGTFIKRFGSQGTGPGQFDRPAGIAVDNRQRIIVADKDNHRIQILQMDGKFVNTFGQKGHTDGQFNYPWDVAVNSECQIAVSDTRNHRVQLFSPDGVFLCKYGYENTPNMWKYFDSPRGVCFTPEGNLIVSDFNNHTLVLIDARFSSARTMPCEAVDNGSKPFLRPQGVVIDNKGNIIVADSRNHRIQVFDPTGRFLWKYGTHGTNMNEMDRPADVALLPNGKIAIVDFGNNRVLLLERVCDLEKPTKDKENRPTYQN